MKILTWLNALRLYVLISQEVYGASSHAFVDRCFWRIWRQGAEPHLFDQYTGQLKNSRISRFNVVCQMMGMPQYHIAARKWRHYTFVESLHMGRCLMVRRVPAADYIVDIGGATPASIQGALLVMGYRHCFHELTIVDLPPDRRICGEYAQADSEKATDGIDTEMGRIRYVHGSMSDLRSFRDESINLVFSGQSIEHVSREAGVQVVREVRRVLKPQGIFFLDTPNALLTRIQSPHTLIHPEHQVEYTPAELTSLLEREGFVIEKMGGIGFMPRTVRTRIFDEREVINHIGLSADADRSYLFYVQAMKQ